MKLSDAVINPTDAMADLLVDASSKFVTDKISQRPSSGWRKLRAAVIGTSMFKHAGQTRDDSYAAPPTVDPVHQKALGLLISVLMSGALSSTIHALPAGTIPFIADQSIVEISQSAGLSQSLLEHAPSFRSAPSVTIRVDSTEVVGSGGMAASTAMKLLRADSRVRDSLPDLKDVFSTAMGSIEECDESCFDKIGHQLRIPKQPVEPAASALQQKNAYSLESL